MAELTIWNNVEQNPACDLSAEDVPTAPVSTNPHTSSHNL
jgi:hypothetical protein